MLLGCKSIEKSRTMQRVRPTKWLCHTNSSRPEPVLSQQPLSHPGSLFATHLIPLVIQYYNGLDFCCCCCFKWMIVVVGKTTTSPKTSESKSLEPVDIILWGRRDTAHMSEVEEFNMGELSVQEETSKRLR